MTDAPNSAPPQLLSLRGVADNLGIDAGQLSKESHRPGFPAHQTADGILFNPAEVARWRQTHVRRRKSAPARPAPAVTPSSPMPAAASPAPASKRKSKSSRPTSPSPHPAMHAGAAQQTAANENVDRPAPSPTMPPGPGPRSSHPAMPPGPQSAPRDNRDRSSPSATVGSAAAEDAPFLAILQSGTASAIDITRATMQLVARRVARNHITGDLGPNDLSALEKSLKELRTAESSYIDLGISRGDLIDRDDVRAIVADCCARLARICMSLENSLALEFSLWLADPKITALSADDRARHIRAFVAKTADGLRNQEANDIDRLITETTKRDAA